MNSELITDPGTDIQFGDTVTDSAIEGIKGRLLANVDASTPAGYELIRQGISEVRTLRTGVEATRKRLKQDALEWGRKVDAEAKRITNKLREIEDPLKEAKQHADDEVDRIRREKQESERRKEAEAREVERVRREREQAEQRRIEQEEMAKERQRLAEEQKKLAVEQERLRLERDEIERERREKEAEERRHRQEIEAKARREREEKEAADRAARDLEEAEARHPDCERLRTWLDSICVPDPPELNSDWAERNVRAAMEEINSTIASARRLVESQEAIYEGLTDGSRETS